MKKIKIVLDGKIKNLSVNEVVLQYDKLIYKICNGWRKSFLFDQSIEFDDLVQDLRLKFLNDLHNYDIEKNDHIMPYMKKIAKNFFISKKYEIISNDKCPTNNDFKPETLYSLNREISIEYDSIKLLDTISSTQYLPNIKIETEDLIKSIQRDLDKINYSPRYFTKRIRSFCRVVFDTVYFQDEKFLNFIRFYFRCKQRYSKNTEGKSSPRTVKVSADALSRYLKVKLGAINYANRKIKAVVISNIKKGGK